MAQEQNMAQKMAQKIDGKAAAEALRAGLAESVRTLKQKHDIVPHLAVVLVGEDPASAIYVKNKSAAAQKIGIESKTHSLPATISEAEILDKLTALNQDPTIHGILVQFPVPPHISQEKLITHIDPAKDVDGLHPLNSGRLALGLGGLVPCTPLGCVLLAKQALGDLAGVRAVIVGRSNLVGKPLAQLLLRAHATVTLAHSRTRDLAALCREADLLVAAVGRAAFIKGDWVKQGATVIDVGINRLPAAIETGGAGERREGTGGAEAADEGQVAAKQNKGRIVGDVDFAEASLRAAYITPVPGGVGPMTIACLMHNTLLACAQQNGITKAELEIMNI